MNKRGFTILEVLISSAVFFVLMLSGVNLLLFSSASWTRIAVNQELLENSRGAMDFLISHIRTADEVTVITDSSHTLKELHTTEDPDSPSTRSYSFKYDKTLPAASPRYHRLEFGGNELASYVRDIKVRVDEEKLLTITIITDDSIEEGAVASPLLITGGTGVRYKKVRVFTQ